VVSNAQELQLDICADLFVASYTSTKNK